MMPVLAAAPALGPCSIPGVSTLCGAGSGIASAIGFASDPLGYIAQQMGSAASFMVSTVLPGLDKLTQPDLTQQWFINAYEFTFALALFMFVAFVGNLFLQRARRRVSGDDLVETLVFYVPAFFVGVIFGPLIGTAVLSFTGALTDVVISSQLTPSTSQTIATLNTVVKAGDPASIGSIVAIVFFAFLIAALVLVFVALLVMLVALYLTGAIFPLSLVWLVNPAQRHRGFKLISVWLGICSSHVLIFLMLGLAFRIVSSAGAQLVGDPSLLELANLAVATIALFIAGLSPLALLKFAPVGASVGGAGGPSASIPSPRSSSDSSTPGQSGSPDDSRTSQLARSTPGGGGDSATSSSPAGVGGGSAGASAGDAGGGGGLLALLDRARSSAASPETGATSAGSGGSGSALGSAETAQAGASGGGLGQLASAGGPAAGGAGAGAAGAAGGEAGAATSAAGAGAAGGSAAAAGAAATGVGLPIAAVLTVAQKAGNAAQSLGDMAAEHMEHGETGNTG